VREERRKGGRQGERREIAEEGGRKGGRMTGRVNLSAGGMPGVTCKCVWNTHIVRGVWYRVYACTVPVG